LHTKQKPDQLLIVLYSTVESPYNISSWDRLCECSAEEQTVDHVFFQCSIHRLPHGAHHLTVPHRSGSMETIRVIAPPTTYENNFIHHDFVQFEKERWRYTAILSSIGLSQE